MLSVSDVFLVCNKLFQAELANQISGSKWYRLLLKQL